MVLHEGNTRTTAVFFIKYLRTLGFDVTNDIFAENAWYFRNALVRANYNDLKNGVHETTEYLEMFLRNLLLDEKNELHNRSMHISGVFEEVDIENTKVDIESEEVDIENTKVDIRNKLLSFSDTISEKTINHTVEIFSKHGKEDYFGRTIVEDITGLKPSGASKLIKLLVDSEVIVPVTGHGKGIKGDVERVLMPFEKLPKTNLRTDILPNSVAVFIMILHYKSVTKYRHPRHTFTKLNGLYAMS